MKSLTTPYVGFDGTYIRRPLQIFLQLLLPCEHKQFRHCSFDWTHFQQPSTVSDFMVRQSWIRWSTFLQNNIVGCCLPSVTLVLSSWQRCQRTVRPSQHRDQQCYQYQRAEFLQWNESNKILESSKLDEFILFGSRNSDRMTSRYSDRNPFENSKIFRESWKNLFWGSSGIYLEYWNGAPSKIQIESLKVGFPSTKMSLSLSISQKCLYPCIFFFERPVKKRSLWLHYCLFLIW